MSQQILEAQEVQVEPESLAEISPLPTVVLSWVRVAAAAAIIELLERKWAPLARQAMQSISLAAAAV